MTIDRRDLLRAGAVGAISVAASVTDLTHPCEYMCVCTSMTLVRDGCATARPANAAATPTAPARSKPLRSIVM